MDNLSNNIRKLRKSLGLNQAQLADKLELKRSTYATYENGGAIPTLDNLLRISNFYGVSIDNMVNDKIENVPNRNSNDVSKHTPKSTKECTKSCTKSEEDLPAFNESEPEYKRRGNSFDPKDHLDIEFKEEDLSYREMIEALTNRFNGQLEVFKKQISNEVAESFKVALEAQKKQIDTQEKLLKLYEEMHSKGAHK